jgi:hypothetical protein
MVMELRNSLPAGAKVTEDVCRLALPPRHPHRMPAIPLPPARFRAAENYRRTGLVDGFDAASERTNVGEVKNLP